MYVKKKKTFHYFIKLTLMDITIQSIMKSFIDIYRTYVQNNEICIEILLKYIITDEFKLNFKTWCTTKNTKSYDLLTYNSCMLLRKELSHNTKFNLILFHTEGFPNDKGYDLRYCTRCITMIANKYFDNIFLYTPKKLRDVGYDYHIKEYPDSGCVSRNPNMNFIGFCAWRPLIMLIELEKMNDGDILIYRDCNIIKYPLLKKYDTIDTIVNNFFDACMFDFLILREHEDVALKHHCKTNIIRELGENHRFTYEFPLLVSSFIAIRKTSISIELLREWLVNCENETYINGKIYGNTDTNFIHHTPEQGILGVIIANWVRKRKHNIPLKYPNIMGRDIHSACIPKNYKYLEYIDQK